MLSPIRLFCHQFLSSDIHPVLEQLAEYYIGLMHLAEYETSNPNIYAKVVPEIPNIHSIFQKVYVDGYQKDIGLLIDSTAILTYWSNYIGYLNQDTVQMALDRSANHSLPHAECLYSLGRLCKREADYTKAEKCLREAAVLFKQNNSTVGEANAWSELGNVFDHLTQLDQAELAFNASLKLYTLANNKLGQANALSNLGTTYISKCQYLEAEAKLMSALEAYKQMHKNIGIANTANSLVNLHNTLNDLAKSEKFAAEALAAAREANFALGKANSLVNQGRISLRTDRVINARQLIEQAVVIFKQTNHLAGQISTIYDLGEVYIRLDQLSAAEALLMTFARVGLDIIEISDILQILGWVYISGNSPDKAESVLDQALLLFRKFDSKRGQASTLAHLGTVYLRSNRLDDAERTLQSIPNLGRLGWEAIDMHRLWLLGDLHIVKGQLEAAEAFLEEAMANAKEYQSSYQQGNILRSMGILEIKQGHVGLAIEKFQAALELHHKAQWVSEQATDLKQLSNAYEMEGRFEDAAAAFEKAEELMESVREARKLAL